MLAFSFVVERNSIQSTGVAPLALAAAVAVDAEGFVGGPADEVAAGDDVGVLPEGFCAVICSASAQVRPAPAADEDGADGFVAGLWELVVPGLAVLAEDMCSTAVAGFCDNDTGGTASDLTPENDGVDTLFETLWPLLETAVGSFDDGELIFALPDALGGPGGAGCRSMSIQLSSSFPDILMQENLLRVTQEE